MNMRIIAGIYKGRSLKTPMNYDIRPTSEMVKEALFSILMNDIHSSVFVDLFAGTGAVGLEALSRGAKKVYLVDRSRDSIGIIKSNVNKIGCQSQVSILASDYRIAMDRINEPVDILFADPPYEEGYNLEILDSISSSSILKDSGVIIIEHARKFKMPTIYKNLEAFKEKKYGKKALIFYRKGKNNE
ncbi:MAG: 16S rRNA (guanine(966)-N(2))-methyltransferase RsmD [Clostridiales bacterium]|nr:16S rRNA (guanine(966)-N(2))-methyltransferase RsmD [Clostridiales bacterium]